MKVLLGSDVDVISPFPVSALPAAVSWMHCYKTLVFGDHGPQTEPEIEAFLRIQLSAPQVLSWGIIDKANLTGSRQIDVPLVGVVFLESLTPENAYIHIACNRKAWGNKIASPGLVDQGCELIKQDVWDTTQLRRVSIATYASNKAARHLAYRTGFIRDGYFENMATLRGVPQDIIHFGMLRPVLAPAEIEAGLPAAELQEI